MTSNWDLVKTVLSYPKCHGLTGVTVRRRISKNGGRMGIANSFRLRSALSQWVLVSSVSPVKPLEATVFVEFLFV